MDLFFADVRLDRKRRAHFNRFMMDVHARIHAERQREGSGDPIPVVARALADEARLLCFDEFQVTDVADVIVEHVRLGAARLAPSEAACLAPCPKGSSGQRPDILRLAVDTARLT